MLTRATTLAIMSLHILLAMDAKFDLETIQLNVVNIFIYTNFDKTVYMQFLPEYLRMVRSERFIVIEIKFSD